MRMLLDECISTRVAPLLAAAGHDVVHVAQRDLLGKPDTEILAVAVAEQRVLVSADTDFGELLARSNLSLPSLILLRQGSRTVEERAATCLLPSLGAVWLVGLSRWSCGG